MLHTKIRLSWFYGFFLGLRNFLRCFSYYDNCFFWLKRIFCNIRPRTIRDFQIYIFLHLSIFFQRTFPAQQPLMIFSIFSNVSFIDFFFFFLICEEWGFLNHQLGSVYTLYSKHELRVCLHNLRSNDKNDLFLEIIPYSIKICQFSRNFCSKKNGERVV